MTLQSQFFWQFSTWTDFYKLEKFPRVLVGFSCIWSAYVREYGTRRELPPDGEVRPWWPAGTRPPPGPVAASPATAMPSKVLWYRLTDIHLLQLRIRQRQSVKRVAKVHFEIAVAPPQLRWTHSRKCFALTWIFYISSSCVSPESGRSDCLQEDTPSPGPMLL